MPGPKLFGESSSGGIASENSSCAGAPAIDEEFAPRITTVTSGTVSDPEYSDSLRDAWTAAHRELPQAKGTEKFLNKIESVNAPQIAEKICKGVDAFMKAVPPLMEALDELAKIHPFVSVAVIAFKAVYTLEKKRSENDKKVLALYVEMKDMMAVLLDLKGVTDLKKIAPDGTTIEGRVQRLCEDVAEDIKKCAGACDTYLRKKLLVKIFAGPVWEEKLLEFVGIFTKRRKEFGLALTLHTAVAVDALVCVVDERTAELSLKMDVMQQLFKEFINSQQRELVMKVKGMGGPAVLENEQAMEELISKELELTTGDGLAVATHSGQNRPFNLVELQREINDDPDKAIEEHAESFNRTFDLQKRIVEELSCVITRDGDRVISALTAGPHDQIVDPDIRLIWKGMGWRGSATNAQLFVTSLRDHFTRKGSGFVGRWETKFMGGPFLSNVLEAFDDDANGLVTIKEVNDFTESRPLNWGLLRWIAYWAIGWQMTCTSYCVKIEEIFDAMIRLSYEVLPENRQAINNYINSVWRLVTVFVQSIERAGTLDLHSEFESYVTAEESRIQRNFEEFKYRIDDPDFVQFISGEGRLETTLFPMFYLALKRDLQKISLARKYVLHTQELVESRTTIDSIVDLATHRIERLKSIFAQQNPNAESRFREFAKGLYNLGSARGLFFPDDQLRELPDPIPCQNDIIPEPDSIPPKSVLNNPIRIRVKIPIRERSKINFAAFRPPVPTLSSTESDHPVLGVHYGFIYLEGKSVDPMIKLTFKGAGGHRFFAFGAHYRRGRYEDYRIMGSWAPSSADGTIPMQLKIIYNTRDEENITTDGDHIELKGTFDPELNTLKGTSYMPFSKRTGEFVFKRDPDIVRFLPAPSTMTARRWWRFATTSVLDDVRKEASSLMRISKRIKDMERFMELTLIESYYGIDLDVEEGDELLLLFLNLDEADVRFCASLMAIHPRKPPPPEFTYSVACNICGDRSVGSGTICIDCSEPTVSLCSEQECLHSTITFETADRKPHLPSHGMFKAYRFIFDRDTARIKRAAKETLEFAHWSVSRLVKKQEQTPGCVRCNVPVSLPCWCCVECTEKEKFICDRCELSQRSFNKTHTKMHTVVRVSDEDEGKEPSTEEQLRLVKDELAKMRQDFEGVTRTLAEMRQQFLRVTQSPAEIRQRFVEVAREVRTGFEGVAQTHAEMRQGFEEVKEEVKTFMEVVRVLVEMR